MQPISATVTDSFCRIVLSFTSPSPAAKTPGTLFLVNPARSDISFYPSMSSLTAEISVRRRVVRCDVNNPPPSWCRIEPPVFEGSFQSAVRRGRACSPSQALFDDACPDEWRVLASCSIRIIICRVRGKEARRWINRHIGGELGEYRAPPRTAVLPPALPSTFFPLRRKPSQVGAG